MDFNLIYSLDAVEFTLELFYKKGKKWPEWTCSLPYQIISEIDCDEQSKEIYVKFDVHKDVTSIIINCLDKSIDDADQILEVRNIWVNGIKLKFEYINDNIFYNNNSWGFQNPQWGFLFEQPFIIWYNRRIKQSVINEDFVNQLNDTEMNRLEFLYQQFSK